jgi:hypothetical protein
MVDLSSDGYWEIPLKGDFLAVPLKDGYLAVQSKADL